MPKWNYAFSSAILILSIISFLHINRVSYSDSKINESDSLKSKAQTVRMHKIKEILIVEKEDSKELNTDGRSNSTDEEGALHPITENIVAYWEYYLSKNGIERYPQLTDAVYVNNRITELLKYIGLTTGYKGTGIGSYYDLIKEKCNVEISDLHRNVFENDPFYYMNWMAIGTLHGDIFQEEIEYYNALDCNSYRSVDTSTHCMLGNRSYEYREIIRDPHFYGDRICEIVYENGQSYMEFVRLADDYSSDYSSQL